MKSDDFYSRTQIGDSEAAAQFSMLRTDLKELLQLIEPGSTLAALQDQAPGQSAASLQRAINELVEAGYVEAQGAQPESLDLDITRCLAGPVTKPTIERMRTAEQITIAGMPNLKEAGYIVNIMSRPAKRIAPRSGDKYQIFIIDADETNTLVTARALLLAGFNTRVAVNRDEIVNGLNHPPIPDVIAMDVVLPDVIGLELLGRLREHPTFRSVPIVVMTKEAKHDDVVAALAYGASSYLTKPFKPQVLLDSVKAVLGVD